mgnify:CR=1 FL=1
MDKNETLERLEKWIDEIDYSIAHDCEDQELKMKCWAVAGKLREMFGINEK